MIYEKMIELYRELELNKISYTDDDRALFFYRMFLGEKGLALEFMDFCNKFDEAIGNKEIT